MRVKYTALLIAVLVILFAVPLDKYAEILPDAAADSDGKASADIISLQKTGEYFVILKNYPYGFTEINWTAAEGVITTNWTAAEGAGNIYTGYYDNGWIEEGPFNGSGHTSMAIESGKIRYRFRGEDTDFGVDAVAWISVKFIEKKQVYGIVGLML